MEPLEALEKLARQSELVRADISDQDTGWYYQFAAAIIDAERAIMNAHNDAIAKAKHNQAIG